MTRRRLELQVGSLLVFETLCVAALVWLGRVDGFRVPAHHLDRWLRDAPADEVAAVTLRVIGLVCVSWLLATTVVYLWARAKDVPWAVRAVESTTLPIVRRWVDRALAVTIVATASIGATSIGDANAARPTPPAAVVTRSDSATTEQPPVVRDGHATTPEPAPTAPPASPPQPDTAPPAPPLPPAAHDTPVHAVVSPGDNLWSISAAHLATAKGRPRDSLTDAEIARYWSTVVARNRSSLRSGNPNLIYPGEVVELPPIG